MNNFYRAQAGDTLLKVSAKLKIPPKKLILENNLSRELEAGDLLIVPRPENIYIVGANETIEGIAQKFGVTAEEIKKANDIDYVFYGLAITI